MLHKNNNFSNYIIAKGEKDDGKCLFCFFYNKKTISYDIIFDESTIYCTHENESINKLFGWKFGIFNQTSSGFGWKPDKKNDTIELYAYCIEKGMKITYSLGNILINQMYMFTIKNFKNFFSFSVFTKNDTLVSYYRISKNNNSKFGRKQLPKISNPKGAIQNMRIIMREREIID